MVPRKANTPTLTREQIVSAAMAIVDRDGLDALSMRRLAAELDVGTMSLYYHVPDKSALYDLILEAVMDDWDMSDDDPDAPVGERMTTMAWALRRALMAHPNAVPIALSRPLRTAGQLRPIEKMLGILFEVGVSPSDAMMSVEVIGHFVFGTSMAYANHLASTQDHEPSAEEAFAGIAPEEFPNLMRAAQEADHVGWDSGFEEGMRALVIGLVLNHIESDGSI
jgi:AcrR family transcriptional regulator